MPQIVTIRSLPDAFNVIKEMQADGCEWGEDYRGASREVLAEIIQGRMREAIDRHLDEMAQRGEADRRNGFYLRHLLTELGRIELCVPRTRRFNVIAVVRAYGPPGGAHRPHDPGLPGVTVSNSVTDERAARVQ